MRAGLILHILLAVLFISLSTEHDLQGQDIAHHLEVRLSSCCGGKKTVTFENGRTQWVEYTLEVALDLQATNPIRQGDLYVYNVPDFSGGIEFGGTAVDSLDPDNPGIVDRLIFGKSWNVKIRGINELHYSISKQRVVYADLELPYPLDPEEIVVPYRLEFIGSQPADADTVYFYAFLPRKWQFGDRFGAFGTASTQEELQFDITTSINHIDLGDRYWVTLTVANPSDSELTLDYSVVTSNEYNQPMLWPLDEWTKVAPWERCDLGIDVGGQALTVPAKSTIERKCYVSHGWNWARPIRIPAELEEMADFARDRLFGALLDQLKDNLSQVFDLIVLLHEAASVVDERTVTYTVIGLTRGAPLVQERMAAVTISPDRKKRQDFSNSLLWAAAAAAGWDATILACSTGDLPLCAAFAVLSYQTLKTTVSLRTAAIDPRDDFTVVAPLKPTNVPAIDDLETSTEKTVAMYSITLSAAAESALLSYARFLGAKEAGASEWAAVQRVATLRFLEEMRIQAEGLELSAPEIISRLDVPDQTAIQQIRASIAKNGLPKAMIKVLQEMETPQEQIEELTNYFLNADAAFNVDFTRLSEVYEVGRVLLDYTRTGIGDLPARTVEAKVILHPDTLISVAEDMALSCVIELPAPYLPEQVEVDSVRIGNVVQPTDAEIGDYDENGIPDLRFVYTAGQLKESWVPGLTGISVSGRFSDSTYFGGTGFVYVGAEVDVHAETAAPPLPVSLLIYPNPANSKAAISYTLPRATDVTLEVYDLLGRRMLTVKDEAVTPGRHETVINLEALSSGMYICRLRTPSFTVASIFIIVR